MFEAERIGESSTDRHRGKRAGGAQAGAGLIEVLLAVLLLAIGLLASSRMQLSSLQANQESHFIGQAGMLAESTIDRMRRNPDGLRDGFYNGADTRDSIAVQCSTASCTPQQLAQSDVAYWTARLAPDTTGVLPALPPLVDGTPAFGTIAMTTDDLYLVTQSWGGMLDGEPADRSAAMSFRP